jgi:hypothetical protein
MTKLCTRCTKIKHSIEFTKDKRYANGLFCWCKECKKQYAKENPTQVQNWIDAHQDEVKAIKNRYVARNPDKVKASKRKWSKANPKKELAKTRKYQASKLNATPSWLSKEQIAEMVKIYVTCPKGYEVDHIVPLQGKNVRGLHVPWNLQHLPIKPNRQKSNKY